MQISLHKRLIRSSVFRGWAMPHAPTPLGKSENIFWQDTLLKMGFQNYIFCSKCRKCRFRDPNFKKFSGEACPRIPLKLCRHYGLLLTKILAKITADTYQPLCTKGWYVSAFQKQEWSRTLVDTLAKYLWR